ncbi:MAG: crossover junction endodeoxyribonuclease RuvC [Chloroflexota bacterium]
MRVLGIDPGTVTMGYGVVESNNDDLSMVDCGALVTSERSPIGERLCYLYRQLLCIIENYHPDMVAVEQPFVAINARSALAIGKAQAIALLAAATHDIPAYEYTPARIKQSVANYGASSKAQVQEMVRLQLNLKEVPQPDDAADALAVAICHLREIHLSELLARQEKKQ